MARRQSDTDYSFMERLTAALRVTLRTLQRLLGPPNRTPQERHRLSWLGEKGHERHRLGWRAEDYAATQLARLGYRLIGRNVPAGHGELDIIAEHDRRLVFVEVRARTKGSLMRPADTVRAEKRRKIIACADAYMRQRHLDPRKTNPRYDIAEVWLNEDGRPCDFSVMEDAFRRKRSRRKRDSLAHAPGLQRSREVNRGPWKPTGGCG